MLSRPLAVACVAALMVVPIEASRQASGTRAPDTPTATTLTGCVSGAPQAGGFTFSDSESGNKYRLSGKSMRKYAGQRVEIVGGPRVKGL